MGEVPEPTREQRRAIEARDRDVFCEAGAGTGKTRVLVGRYCEAIESDGLEVDSILAFTFTERAAGELRTRIRHELARRAALARERGEPDLAARLGRAARATEGAWVTTIHGFCRRLLAAHPAAAGIDPRFRVLDEGEAGRLRRRAREAAIDDVVGADPGAVEVIAAYRPRRIAEMAAGAHERLRSLGAIRPRLPDVPEPVRSRSKGEDEPPPLSPAEASAARAAHRTLGLLVEAFGRRYGALKAERSALDFADLELGALELLRSSPAVRAAWRGRFEHLMVDEFQDTNRVQLELVEGLRGERTQIFVVGDELQSIYRFRNADLEVFREQRAAARTDPATAILPLTGNFRARPGLVAAANALGAALLGDGFTRLAALREPATGGPRAELLLSRDANGDEGWGAHAVALDPPASDGRPGRVAEARALAERLRALVDAGEAMPGEIVVLLRAFTHVDAYEEALERFGLDPYVVGGRGYWSAQQVEDLLRVLECVANPLDDEMLLGALAGPAAAVSPDALWLLRRAEAGPPGAERRAVGHLWPLVSWRFGGAQRAPEAVDERRLEAIPNRDAERLRRFCERLDALRRAAPVLALDELVERALTAFGLDLAVLRLPRGAGRMANVRKLVRLAREYEAHEGRDLRGFLISAAELTERDEREGLAAVQAEDHDGVRVMTVHAAKGLEFEVVAVADLARGLAQGERAADVEVRPRRDAATGDAAADCRLGLRLALPVSESIPLWELRELAADSVAEAAEEGARLVHVAATRARERLILSGSFRVGDLEPKRPEPGDGPLRRLLPALVERGWQGEDDELELPAAPGPHGEPGRLAIRVSAPGRERAERLAARRPPPQRPARSARGTAPLGRPAPVVPAGHLSYTAISDYRRCAYRFHVERMLGLTTPAAPTGDGSAPVHDLRRRRLGFGTAVHAALERSAARGWRPPDDDELAGLLAAEGIEDPEELARARAMVTGWLGSALLAQLRDSPLRAEVPFALAVGGAIVRGQIDLLAEAAGRDEGQLDLLGPDRADEPTLIDFKTDHLDGGGVEEAGARYDAQRRLYALALSRARGDDAPVRAIHVFLEAPDDPVEERLDAAALADAEARFGATVAAIGSGEFAPTPAPSRSVCLECPAAARLCPHPKWGPRA